MDIDQSAVQRAECCLRVALLLCTLLVSASHALAASLPSKVNINHATAAELAEALPGIGPVKAARIVDHRVTVGPFDSVDALLDVKGIGPATLGKLRHLMTVGAVLDTAAEQRETATRDAVRRVIVRARGGAAQGSGW